MRIFIHQVLVLTLLSLISTQAHAQKITTIAGNGTEGYSGNGGKALSAELHWPQGLAIDRFGRIYIADADNNCVRRISPFGIITTIAGTAFNAGSGFGAYSGDGGQATAAELYGPSGVAVDTAGNIFIADALNNVIRKVDTGGVITTVVGTGSPSFGGDGGPATAARLNQPLRIALDTFGNMYIADAQNHRIRKVDVSQNISTVAGTGTPNYSGDGGPATAADLDYPADVAVDTFGALYIADELNSRIRKVDPSGNITTIVGNGIPAYGGDGGPATAAELFYPLSVALDDSGNLFISDNGNYIVRKVNKKDTIATYAGMADSMGYTGDGGPATAARLWFPQGLIVNKKGSLYIADYGNNRVRFIGSAVEAVSTVNTLAANVSIYPNPGRGIFTIRVSSPFNEQAQAVITNINGERIKEATIKTNVPQEITFDESPGIYFLSINTVHGIWSGKLMVK